MSRLLLLTTLAFVSVAQTPPRVFVISLDGFGYEALTTDPAAASMSHLQRMVKEGVAMPMQTSFPSLTAAGHASLFTGVYGDKNGVTANNVPRRPRNAFHFDESVNGFRAEQLDVENFWLPLGRSGAKIVAHNTTQGFPCTGNNSGPGVTLMNGYQTEEVVSEQVLRGNLVKWLERMPEGFRAPAKSKKPPLYFEYTANKIRFVGAVYAKSRRYDTVRVSAASTMQSLVEASVRSAEDEPLDAGNKPRELARYFSPSLAIGSKSGVFYRLFELSEDGREFLLYQTPGKELSLCSNGQAQGEELKKKVLAAGAFVGNSAGSAYSRGSFGPILQDGKAERRLLETMELHARQTMRHSKQLRDAIQPRLFVDYISTIDDMNHLWWGMAMAGDHFLDPYRAWGYQIADWRVGVLKSGMNQDDHLIAVSDHGMAAMQMELRPNVLLKQWGFRDRIFASYYGLFVNTTDWRGGLVEPNQSRALLEEVRRKLAAYEVEGQKIFVRWFWQDEIAQSYGVGSDRAAQLYFDLAPGWFMNYSDTGSAVRKLERPKGEHGLLPTRPELKSIFVHFGPNINARPASMKTVDVAPLVLKLLAP